MMSKGGRPATEYVEWRRNAKTGLMQWHVPGHPRGRVAPLRRARPAHPEPDREAAKAKPRSLQTRNYQGKSWS